MAYLDCTLLLQIHRDVWMEAASRGLRYILDVGASADYLRNLAAARADLRVTFDVSTAQLDSEVKLLWFVGGATVQRLIYRTGVGNCVQIGATQSDCSHG